MKILSKFIIRMIAFLIIISVFFLYNLEKLNIFFNTNPTLNSVIIAVLVLGIILMFRQILVLAPEINWMESFMSDKKKPSKIIRTPKLLKPMSQIMRSQMGDIRLTQIGLTSIMESLQNRLFEMREISRYFIGLLVFLGLLGTFWGLLETINSVSSTVKNLDFSKDTDSLFFVLKDGLEKPLSGMGTAFSSSLFGLGGSLILGFLDLQSGQAQNRFFNEVEEKLANFTKISNSTSDSIKNDFAPAYIESLIESTTENLKKSTSSIEQQQLNQDMIVKSLSEINQFLNTNINTNKIVADEIKILSKTIANIKRDK
ncbi:MAG: flagellar motor protein MotA [Rickettsiales bacterium]|nr:flagellar motor protein MotA [Rickettsiales bacterium]OUV53699.1 MAG: hypothetical protein CBC87_03060 [Rickettsiales bacterium TMED127]